MSRQAKPGEVKVWDSFFFWALCALIAGVLSVGCGALGFHLGGWHALKGRDAKMERLEAMITSGSGAFARLLYGSGEHGVCNFNGGLKEIVLTPPNDREFSFVCRSGAKFEFIKVDLKIAGVQ